MPSQEHRLILRRVAAVLNVAFGALQITTALTLGVAFGGMGALFAIIGVAEGDPVPQVLGAALGGFGVVFAALLVLLFLPHLLAGAVLWQRGGFWREIVALCSVLGALTQFPLGTVVAVFTMVACTLELAARSQPPAPATGS